MHANERQGIAAAAQIRVHSRPFAVDLNSYEMEKLEGWAGDLKESLEHELKEIDREIKETRREAQLATSLETKVTHHKRIKELEARRAEKRRGQFEAQDAVDARKDTLLAEIEARLKQGVRQTELFTVRWHLQ